ncbi:MAG: nitroreductase [Planctomycetota bacterium]|jgi:nitroreductase
MTLLDTILARRSVKQYDTEHKLTDDELQQLLKAAVLAPTSFNMQNRHFVVALDPEVREKLMGAAWGQKQVSEAAALFVITGDFVAHRNAARYLRDAPKPTQEALEPMIMKFYEGNDALVRDEACRSVGLAGMNIMLMAKDMGYDSCPLIGFDPAKVSEVLGLDENHPPLMMVTVGRQKEAARPRMGLLDLSEQVSIDRFGNNPIEGAPDA